MSTAPDAASHAAPHATDHGTDHATDHAHRPEPRTGEGGGGPSAPAAPLAVLVYSDDPRTREQVMLAIGRHPTSDLPPVEYVELDTSEEVVATVDEGGIDLAILDGEAAPVGGIGLCRQLKNEVRSCPAIMLLTGRRDDRWLAVWSQADGAVSHPIDAIELVDAVVELLRSVPRLAAVTRPQ
ncbi:MAG: hypothetical protein ACJ74O_10965 [Frankiaceae bacterium]